MRKLGHKQVNLFELLICLTDAGNLVSHELANHHQQVSYLVFKIAEKLNLSMEHKRDLIIAHQGWPRHFQQDPGPHRS